MTTDILTVNVLENMPQRERRGQIVTVALPGSLTRDNPHLREKTWRIGLLGRALAIFRVDRVIIYNDWPIAKKADADADLLEKILRFQETPQYLRKYLFKIDPDLQFAGTLPPLRIPSHPDRADPATSQIREGVVVSTGQVSRVDAGFKQPVSVNASLKANQRVTLEITRVSPRLEGKVVNPDGLRIYWGFKVKREAASLAEIARKKEIDLRVSTSREGEMIQDVTDSFKPKWLSSKNTLLMFGSPERGIEEILADTGTKVGEISDFNLNTIPCQGVETVRTEEAVMITLSTINLLETM